jgi:hypothetical protein
MLRTLETSPGGHAIFDQPWSCPPNVSIQKVTMRLPDELGPHIRKPLSALYPVKITVFGFYGRGEADLDSNIDDCIEPQPFTPERFGPNDPLASEISRHGVRLI